MLKFENVNLKFVKDYYALCNVNLLFEEGKIYNIVGESASGKASILRCISKLEDTYTGVITYNNLDIKQYDFEKELGVGYIPQIPVLLENKTVKENLEYVVKNRQIVQTSEMEYFVFQVLKSFNLDMNKDKKVKKLDFFNKHKISFARLSMRKLNILLIDNIFDMLGKEETMEFFGHIKNYLIHENCICIIASSTSLEDYEKDIKVININAGIIENNS